MTIVRRLSRIRMRHCSTNQCRNSIVWRPDGWIPSTPAGGVKSGRNAATIFSNIPM